MRRKIIIILSVLTISMCLGACGNKEVAVESTETTVVATPEPTVEPTPEPTPTPTPEPSNEFASVEEVPVEYLESMAIEDVIIVGGVEFICTEPCKATNETNYLAVEEVEGSEPVVAMYDVVTVVEIKDFISYNQEGAVVNEGTETLYSDGTSAFDFNVTRHGYTTHFKFANVPSNMEDRAAKTKINFFAHRYYEKCEDGSEKHFWIRIIPAGETSDKLADLNSLDEAFLKQKIEVETVDMSTKQIFETEDYNALLIEYDSVIDSYEMRGHCLLLNDLKTNQSYTIRVDDYVPNYDRDYSMSVLKSVEIIY